MLQSTFRPPYTPKNNHNVPSHYPDSISRRQTVSRFGKLEANPLTAAAIICSGKRSELNEPAFRPDPKIDTSWKLKSQRKSVRESARRMCFFLRPVHLL